METIGSKLFAMLYVQCRSLTFTLSCRGWGVFTNLFPENKEHGQDDEASGDVGGQPGSRPPRWCLLELEVFIEERSLPGAERSCSFRNRARATARARPGIKRTGRHRFDRGNV